ncbi:MAG TPA: DVUA0089 family protein [Phototrophicaceae bacterium]|nr:DVUA0089 family protein [Phototrophicaceae bacterium]
MSSEALQQAYRLIREGNKQDAARLLVPIVRADPLNADAWWLLANAVENTQQQARALRRVLSLRPNDPRATEMLARLQANAALSASAGAPVDNLPLGDVQERKSRPISLLLVLIGVITIIGCAACIGVAALSQTALQGVYGRVILTVTAVANFNQPFSTAPTQIPPTAIPTLPPDLIMRGSINDGQTVSNTVATFTDDGWTFSATTGERVSIELDAVDPKLDPQLYLYGPNGVLVAENDDIDGANNRNSRLDLTLTNAGTYTIRVGKFADGGQYRLSLQPSI